MARSFWLFGLAATLAEAQLNRTISFDITHRAIDNNGTTMAVIPSVILEDSHLLQDTGLERRKAIDVVVAVSTAAGAGFTAIIAANAAVDLYDNIAAKIKAKSDANSCTLTYGTDGDDGYYEGYAYQATTTGSDCDTTAIQKTINNAVAECANSLHAAGMVRGCCRFSHGGDWTGHLRLTNAPNTYPATSVNC